MNGGAGARLDARHCSVCHAPHSSACHAAVCVPLAPTSEPRCAARHCNRALTLVGAAGCVGCMEQAGQVATPRHGQRAARPVAFGPAPSCFLQRLHRRQEDEQEGQEGQEGQAKVRRAPLPAAWSLCAVCTVGGCGNACGLPPPLAMGVGTRHGHLDVEARVLVE